jgi:predicted PurR-regulated permease PerM
VPSVATTTREQRIALDGFALAAFAVIAWLVSPVAVGILLGVFLAFVAQPMFERFRARVKAPLAAAITVLTCMIVVVVAIGGLGYILVTRGAVVTEHLVSSFQPGGAGARAVTSAGRVSEQLGFSSTEIAAHVRPYVDAAAQHAASAATAIAAATGHASLGLLFAALAMYYVLRDGGLIIGRAEEALPLKPEHTAALFDEFRKVGRTTLLGALGTGFAQGALATIGYALAGVPEPLFFGALTMIASFVPGVGVMLIILPVSVGLFLQGAIARGIFEVAWSLILVVGVCDYVIRPRLARGETRVSSLATFAALFGGTAVLGLKGLIVGPVLMSMAIAVLRLYLTERRNRPTTV